MHAPMHVPVCSIQRLAELQTPATGKRESSGAWRAVIGGLGWRVAGGVRQVAGSVC